MTREEAVEEVLRGPYSPCLRCKGDGTVMYSTHRGGMCSGCKGAGKFRRMDYVQACFELDIEPAPQMVCRKAPIFVKYPLEGFRTLSLEQAAQSYNYALQRDRVAELIENRSKDIDAFTMSVRRKP